MSARCESGKSAFDRRELSATDSADDAILRNAGSNYAGQIRAFLESKINAGPVLARAIAGRRQVHRLRIVRRDALHRVLILESVGDDQIVSLGAVLAEVFVELGWCLCLDVADLRAEAVSDAEEATVGSGVPRLVGDRTGRQQRHLEPFVAGGCRPVACASTTVRVLQLPTCAQTQTQRDVEKGRDAHEIEDAGCYLTTATGIAFCSGLDPMPIDRPVSSMRTAPLIRPPSRTTIDFV